MNSNIFLTDEGYTFQPETDANIVYRNLLADNPQLMETSFEKIFCYQLDKKYEGSRKDYNLNVK